MTSKLTPSTDSHIRSGPSMEQLLSLEALGPLRFAAHHHQTNRNNVLYGGELIGQTLVAALATVPHRIPHALQVSFQGPTRATQNVIYDVEATRDGGSLTTRRIVATQADEAVLFATASFRDQESGYAHEQRWRVTPPMPESLPSLTELSRLYADRVGAHGRGRLSCYQQVDVRPVDPETHLLIKPGAACNRLWIRANISSGTSEAMSYAVLAYLSDYLLVNAALIPHAAQLPESRLFTASLNHSVWFHRFDDLDDWLLYETESPWAGDAHALMTGRFYNRSGQLIASTAQEALVRELKADV